MSEEIALTIIGAGAVGCAVACEISRDFSGDIAVVEKNSRITGENQSSRNSGVIHAGIYYPGDIGPFKASMCVEGNSLLYEFCKNNNVLHKKT
ncbi:MAG: FAD-dependent oxidoreductase, partial [Actinobacteria bacterium]|nr:FAD-dependent oxidoreductase [Actinomycetota bacterium]